MLTIKKGDRSGLKRKRGSAEDKEFARKRHMRGDDINSIPYADRKGPGGGKRKFRAGPSSNPEDLEDE